jgi:hypothetical protein
VLEALKLAERLAASEAISGAIGRITFLDSRLEDNVLRFATSSTDPCLGDPLQDLRPAAEVI